ncbi:dicarboxylate/amino acid:cation symporter [Singulisphaera sp. Ch08]|uniref:Dicarboxylate/amino acid:cation symporter n=1 Tax=Singulisphaera sp. Ch08 TaxID=3120278 RepID=A0AAU7CE54_9BACT
MSSLPSGPRRRLPFFARILAAMVLGVIVGLVFGPRAEPLGQLGSVIIGLIKTLAAPLLFFAVVDAFLRTHIRLRSGLIMLAITATNAALAVVIGLTLSNTLRPGDHLTISKALVAEAKSEVPESKKIDFLRELTNYIPTSVVRPFLDNSIISIIILALLSGIALRHVKNEQLAVGEHAYRVVEQFVATIYRAIEVVLGGVITFVPLAVFGVVAKMIGQEGFTPLVGLAAYVGVAVLGLAIQVLVVYQAWIVFVSQRTLREFWTGARDAVVYALGASSSLASLPVTLRCLDRMKVSPQSARLAACVGTNLNNDGILLYEAMAVLFVAQVYGIELSFGQQLLTAASCVIAGIGIAAVPDAGLISLALVLATVGLPLELLPLLLTVDWLLSRCRAMTNVTSDILVAVLLDRFDKGERMPEEGPDSECAGQEPVALGLNGHLPAETA